jgi:hypothetical protein
MVAIDNIHKAAVVCHDRLSGQTALELSNVSAGVETALH